MATRRILIDRPTGPPNPFECYLLLACVIQGVAVLTGQAQPTAMQDALSPTLFHVWAGLLAVGGSLGLAGLLWPGDPFTGVEIKRVGLVAVAFGTLAYGVALTTFGPIGFVVAASNIGFAVAALVRIRQINAALKRVRSDLADLRD